jgi:hypothetical protein
MALEIYEIEQMMQSKDTSVRPLEDMLLNYELVYSLLDKIAHELGSMIQLMDQESDVKSPVTASPTPVT